MEVNCSYDTMKVTMNDIQDAINKLDCNKSCGNDDIYAEHLKYASEKIYPLLSMCFIGFLCMDIFQIQCLL